jgi:hypothetical protein
MSRVLAQLHAGLKISQVEFGSRSKASTAAVAQFSVGSCVRARTGAGWFVKDGAGSGAGLITRSTPVTDAVAAEPEVDLSALKIAELRDMCESKGLSTSGKKEELVARLSESARGPPQSSSTRDERAANRERARKRSRPETETKGEFD